MSAAILIMSFTISRNQGVLQLGLIANVLRGMHAAWHFDDICMRIWLHHAETAFSQSIGMQQVEKMLDYDEHSRTGHASS